MATDVRLTPQDLDTTGQAVTRTALVIAATSVYQVLLSPGGTIINWVKTGANPATVTVVLPGTVDGQAITDREIVVAATNGDVVAEFFPEHYANADGDLEFTVSEATDITAAVFQR